MTRTEKTLASFTDLTTKRLIIGPAILGFILALSIVAPWITRYDPDALEAPAATRYLPPAWQHFFGTDQFGRDVCARVLHGGRLSLCFWRRRSWRFSERA